MDAYLAYFLELRVRLRGRKEAVALVDRCIRILAEAEDAPPEVRARLGREIEELRRHLVARFGAKPPATVH
jgi:hypothetical protein